MRVSQQSIFVLSSLAYHDYERVALNDDERPRLVRDLGDKQFLMLRDHGLLTVADDIRICSFTCTVSRSPAASRSPR